ncbi:hypothetical protein CDES_01595 [Corynebacterium deserti GIMN1.010]|uniref:DUF4244 domain-containing protein n=1 Tax=Corynebacterium deserti GIMN1.010 TaxID=931089 RepID=A0A0M4CE56_9CORY|nr:DUF4244 domain-containing protein [Corynebacterium deserti]ALC04790.1 hypothetical protein CDES_01595 [Corynebacterium deserti GIMN1.010]
MNAIHTQLIRLRRRSVAVLAQEDGLTTVEYALGTLAAAALAAVLYMVVNSDAVASAFESIISDALSARP